METQRSELHGNLQQVFLISEAASYARVSQSLLRAAIRRGELKAIRVGRGKKRMHVRVTRAALLRWLGIEDNHIASGGEVQLCSLCVTRAAKSRRLMN
jgi:excisionase family DNA binding protein